MPFAYDSMTGVRPREVDAIGRDQLVDFLAFFNEKLVTYNDSYLDVNRIWQDVTVGEGLISEEFLGCGDLNAFGRARECLRRYSDFLNVLRPLMTSLNEKVASAEAWVNTVARQGGLNKLSDESLYEIMEYTVSNFNEACALSHVCVRFRSLILSSPKIWANCELTLSLTPSQISAIVQRSKGLPLKVEILSRVVDRYPTRLSRILQHSAVIGELSLMPVNVKKVVEQFREIELPLLRTLKMAWDLYLEFMTEINGGDKPDRDPYKTWTVPQLRHLYTDFVPSSQLGRSQLGRNLLVLGIRLYNDETLRTVGDVFKFLASCPLLEILALTLQGRIEQMNIGGVVSLGNLESLIICVDPEVSPAYLRHILENISAENLSNVSFTLYARKEDQRCDYGNYDGPGSELGFPTDSDTPSNICSKCGVLLGFVKGLPVLESFDVHVEVKDEGRSKWNASLGLRVNQGFLVRLPDNLETFVLTTPSHRLTVHRGTSAINGPAASASIGDVDFWDADDLTLDSLLKVKDGIVATGVHLRKVGIRQCPLMREEELREAITDAEVVYIA